MKKERHTNTERLLDVLNHPEQYSDKELEQLFADEDFAAEYRLLVDAASADEYAESQNTVDDDTIDKEWRRLQSRLHATGSRRYRVAVAVAALLVLSGAVFASILLLKSPSLRRPVFKKQTVESVRIDKPTASHDTVVRNAPAVQPSTEAQTPELPSRQFENTELQDMLSEMAEYYHLQVVYHDESTRHLRLHYLWERKNSAVLVVESLNMFDKVNLSLEGDVLTVN